MSNWDNCEHEWEEVSESQSNNEYSIDVECIKCLCPGSKDLKTQEVYWPTT